MWASSWTSRLRGFEKMSVKPDIWLSPVAVFLRSLRVCRDTRDKMSEDMAKSWDCWLSLNTADTLLLSEDLWRVVAHSWSNMGGMIMRNLIRNVMNCCNRPWTFYFWVTIEILARPLVDRYGLWQRGFYSGTFFTLWWSANTFVISEEICRYHEYPWISHRIGEVVICAPAIIPLRIWA